MNTLSYQSLFGLFNQQLNDRFVGLIQLLSKLQLVKTPHKQARRLGQDDWTYEFQPDWSKADPNVVPIRNCHEMEIDKNGRLYLLTDHPDNNVVVYDLQGNLLDHWTLGMKSAHGLTMVDESNSQVLWICDAYSGKVVKTSLTGEVLQTLASPHELGIYRANQGYAPTQTAVAENGDIYVADGYGSQFVIQYSKDGEYIRHFGGKGLANSNLDFAHGIAIDSRAGKGKEVLLVTSRRQSCIKQFTLDGELIGKISLPGAFPCRPVIHREHIYIGLCWSGVHLKPNSGFVIVLDQNNEVCATLGGTAVLGATGSLHRLRSDYSSFHHVHDVTVDNDGNIYVCEWNAGGAYPVKLEKLRDQ